MPIQRPKRDCGTKAKSPLCHSLYRLQEPLIFTAVLRHLPLSADDLDAAARPEARRPRGDHRLSIRTAADTARRLDPHRRAHGLAHQCDIGRRCTARGEPRRGLDEVRPRLLREAAGRALLRVGQKAGLDDDLRQGFSFCRSDDARNIRAHIVIVPVLQAADGDHHVHFLRAVRDCLLRLEYLHRRRRRTLRKANDRAGLDARAAQLRRYIGHPNRADADGGEMILFCLAEQLVDTGSRRIRFQQGVIDHCCNVHVFLLSL